MPSATALYNTGKWLNAADLANNAAIGLNKRVPAIVHHCEPEQIGMGADQKTMLMVELVSKQGQAWPKKLPLNKTNTLVMVAAYGDDYGQWPGKPIEIWAENVPFQGKLVPGLKVQPAPNTGNGNGQAIPLSGPATATAQAPASPPPSATAVAGMPPAAGPSWTPPRNANTAPIEDDEIPF